MGIAGLFLDQRQRSQTLTAGEPFSYTFPENTFHDPDGDTLSYSAYRFVDHRVGAVWPSWLRFDASTRTFSGTPLRDDVGFYNVTVIASDGYEHFHANRTETFVIRVHHKVTGEMSILSDQNAFLDGVPPRHPLGPVRMFANRLLETIIPVAHADEGTCGLNVGIRFRNSDGSAVAVDSLSASDLAVENGEIGNLAEHGDGWRLTLTSHVGFSGVMRLRILSREPADIPDGDEASAELSDEDLLIWDEEELVVRVSSDGNCDRVATAGSALTGVTVFDSTDDSELGQVPNGGSMSLEEGGSYRFRADVDADSDVGSVVWSLDAPADDDDVDGTDDDAPYSVDAQSMSAGTYTLTATAYAGDGGEGAVQGTVVATIEIPDGGALTGFVLVDVSDQSTVAALANGAAVDLGGRSGGSFGIRAKVASGEEIGSVALSLSGAKTVSRTENLAPYSLYGDHNDGNGGRALDGSSLPAGTYTLSATAYAERGASGTTQGTLSVSFRVLAPAALTVADARAEEGTDATLDFAVTLDRSSTGTVTVGYATADGTATAGSDYTATSGTLTFASGETTKTVSVPVLDDGTDEGSETLTLRLSSATGASIADGEAVGTIANTDPVQRMWLSRFGRTVGSQVVDAVAERLGGALAGAEVTLGGQRLDLARMDDEAALAEAVTGLAHILGGAPGRSPDPADGLSGSGVRLGRGLGAGAQPGAGASRRGLSGRELLLESAFHFAAANDGGGPGYAAWGGVTAGGFNGEEAHAQGPVHMNGEVTTGILGADAAWERWLAGVAVSVSEGDGTYAYDGVGSGTLESSLTGVHPYARLQVNERVQAWGLLGFGSGEMTMRPEGDEPISTDLEMRLGAVGARGVLLEAGETGGLDLALEADAFVVEGEWDPVSNEPDTTAGSRRLRLALEGSRILALGEGAVLTPGIELGLRHDGGDAESGMGIELGGRIGYANASSGLSVEASARTLLTHENSGYEDWGASGSVRLDPGASGRGLSLTVAPAIGAAVSGMERLWSLEHSQGLAANDEFEAEGRLRAELGYGLPVFGVFTGTPYAGLGLSDGGRDWRVGWRVHPARPGLDLELGVEGTWAEPANDEAGPEHGVMLRGSIRW